MKIPKCLRHPLWLAAIMLLAWYISFGYKYGFIYNHGISMQPTIANGEWIIMQKRSSIDKKWIPDRYDIVIIDDMGSNERLSKRIIGLPKDTIEVDEGVIYLNGKELQDPYGKGKIRVYLVDDNDENLTYWNGPEAGKPVVQMTNDGEKEVPEGYVWVIGDNRSDSWYGMLPIKDIEGLAIIY